MSARSLLNGAALQPSDRGPLGVAVKCSLLLPPQSIRGERPHFQTYDEAAFEPDPDVFKKGMFPIQTQRRTITALLSTPGDKDNYFMRLLAQVDENGQPRMRLVRVGQPCADCMQTTTSWTCQHMRHIMPPWQSKTRQNRLAWLYLDDVGTMAQEQMAVTQDQSRYALGDAENRWLRTHQPLEPRGIPPYVCLGLDAALGGENEFAIVAVYPETPHKLAVGHFCSFLRVF